MIEKSFLENYAGKIQTSFKNIVREYFQHLFLSYFYQQKKSEHFYFKGGTALKLVFNSPRFSEDLDFSAFKNSFNYENILQEVLLNIEKEGIHSELEESKKTSGGHLVIIKTIIYDELLEIKTEVSYRNKNLTGEKIMIVSDFFPSYTAQILDAETIVHEKQNALLERHKPRDLFDLYFILRSERLRKYMHLDEMFLNKTEELIEKINSKQISNNIKQFLPRSFWPIVKDLRKNLLSELRRLL